MRSFLIVLALAASSAAAEIKIHRDLSYAEPKSERNMLDVYTTADAKDRPVVFWIHGGGWRRGDKGSMQHKPQAFIDQGYLFVASNYRFVPEVTVAEQTTDLAKAIAWVHKHAAEYGGDPNRIIVMGHSAGAHLAALVSTDDSHLKSQGLSLAILKACMPVDVSAYDVPRRLAEGSGRLTPEMLKELFGETEEAQRAVSPAWHVAQDKHIPPFLILHVADRADTKVQSEWFAKKLTEAGITAKVYAAEGKTHGTINSDLGQPDDKPTQAMWEFLETALKK